MPRRTRKQALIRCKDIWSWLAKIGVKDKKAAYRALGFDFYSDECLCPACEYHARNGRYYCGKSCIIPWPGNHCEHPKSPFYRWISADTRSKTKKHAAEIVKLCDLALKKGGPNV